jgi:hypothetical protein
MSSDVSRFSPPTEALALQYEHLENRTWANRSISRVLAEIKGNNLTDQATRSHQKKRGSRLVDRLALGHKPFPMALGDNFDCSVDHFDGGLIVNRVRRHRPLGGPFFCVGHGIVRTLGEIQVRKQRKINQS